MMKSADLIRELIKAGWIQDRVRGSHHVFTHPSRPGIVVVPHPRKGPRQGTGRENPQAGRYLMRYPILIEEGTETADNFPVALEARSPAPGGRTFTASRPPLC